MGFHPHMRKNIRRFWQYDHDMDDLPDPLDPGPLPFDLPLRQLFTRIFSLPVQGLGDRRPGATGAIGDLLIGREAKAAARVVEAPQQRLKYGQGLGGDGAVVLAGLGAARQRPRKGITRTLALRSSGAGGRRRRPSRGGGVGGGVGWLQKTWILRSGLSNPFEGQRRLDKAPPLPKKGLATIQIFRDYQSCQATDFPRLPRHRARP